MPQFVSKLSVGDFICNYMVKLKITFWAIMATFVGVFRFEQVNNLFLYHLKAISPTTSGFGFNFAMAKTEMVAAINSVSSVYVLFRCQPQMSHTTVLNRSKSHQNCQTFLNNLQNQPSERNQKMY